MQAIVSARKIALGIITVLSLVLAPIAQALTVGFSQIGSESGWRTAETQSIKSVAQQRGITLKFSDAQQKQENQIKAIRSFIAQRVDAIILAPVVETGWDQVLREAKRAHIPVFLVDRGVKVRDSNLYVTKIASDFVEEGRLAGAWLAGKTSGHCKIVELQGTVGSSAAIDRKKGFANIIDLFPRMSIIRSQSGDFTRSGGKNVMESFLKSENGGKTICAVYSHNDDMALGAIQAIQEAGLKPSKDILIISIDGVPDIFKAMMDGQTNATIELKSALGEPAFDAIKDYLAGKKLPKWIKTQGDLYLPDTAKAQYESRTAM
ncbi:ABC transporter substrate-binding protein [Celerinatantimonas yamalensis]|uniref:ABC transporter substrate-binding protein n=1 Tax=Celerinatantimonas yamalensis TaxID=559956 RepID=A0ABW9G2V7_9GAMM